MNTCDTSIEVVRRLMDQVWGEGRFDLLPDLIAPDYVAHLPIGDHYGPDGVRIDIAGYRAAIPDLAVKIEELIRAGNTVVRRFTLQGTQRGYLLGRDGHDRPVRLAGIGLDRLESGKLIESWVVISLLGVV